MHAHVYQFVQGVIHYHNPGVKNVNGCLVKQLLMQEIEISLASQKR